jgi:hypothetical protein
VMVEPLEVINDDGIIYEADEPVTAVKRNE